MQAIKPPRKYKRKAAFFLKHVRAPLTADKMNSVVTHGDLGESPLETLSLLSQEVLLPVLANPANQAGWPDVIAKDVTDTLHKFISEGSMPAYRMLLFLSSCLVIIAPS